MIRADTYATLVSCGPRALETRHGDFVLHRFKNFATRSSALAISLGDLASPEPLLTRVHSSCLTSEAFGGCDCDCAEQLEIAFAEIAGAGRGVIFYLMQEGRGAGFVAKARDRMAVQASGNRLTTFEAYERMGLGSDHRRYDEVEAMARLLGIRAPLRLLSNNPEKAAALAAEGLTIETRRSVGPEPSPFNRHYLDAKLRSGHSFLADGGADHVAELPESVAEFTPYAVEGEPRLVHMASYLLPIRLPEWGRGSAPVWFGLHAYFDVERGREHVVLTHRRRAEAVTLVGVHREALVERLPLRRSDGAGGRWRETVDRVVECGAGAVLFLAAEDVGAAPAAGEADFAALLRHVGRRRIRPLDPSDRELGRRLAAVGFAVEASS